MDRREQERCSPECESRKSPLLYQWIENSTKEHFLGDRRQQDGCHSQGEPAGPGTGDTQGMNGLLLLRLERIMWDELHQLDRDNLEPIANGEKNGGGEHTEKDR